MDACTWKDIELPMTACLGLIMLFCCCVGNLFPFGTSYGDQEFRNVDDGASDPQTNKNNLTFPFFNAERDNISVSSLSYGHSLGQFCNYYTLVNMFCYPVSYYVQIYIHVL